MWGGGGEEFKGSSDGGGRLKIWVDVLEVGVMGGEANHVTNRVCHMVTHVES